MLAACREYNITAKLPSIKNLYVRALDVISVPRSGPRSCSIDSSLTETGKLAKIKREKEEENKPLGNSRDRSARLKCIR